MAMSWLAAKKYYELKDQQKQSEKTFTTIVGTTFMILVIQFIWKKTKQMLSGRSWKDHMTRIKQHEVGTKTEIGTWKPTAKARQQDAVS